MVKSETGENFESHALTMMLAHTYSGFPEGLENLELGSSHGKVMEFFFFLTNFFENEMINFMRALDYVDTIFFYKVQTNSCVLRYLFYTSYVSFQIIFLVK